MVGQSGMQVVGVLRLAVGQNPGQVDTEALVSAKGAVIANGMVEMRGMLPLELSILNWLLDGIIMAVGWHHDRCMRWGEGIHENLIVQAIPWQACIPPRSLAEQAVVLDACPRCELPEQHCHEGLVFHQG